MSYSLSFFAVALAEDVIPKYFPRQTAELILGRDMPDARRTREGVEAACWTCEGTSRSEWFARAVKAVLGASREYEPLRFIARETATHREQISYGIDGYSEEHFHTVLTGAAVTRAHSAVTRLISAIRESGGAFDSLIEKALDDVAWPPLVDAMAQARSCRDVNREAPYGEDGNTSTFLASALCSIEEGLNRAHAGSLVFVYTNVVQN